MSARRPQPQVLLLGLALAASSALLLALGTSLTFFGDTWAFLLARDGPLADDLLQPHNEHIVVLPYALQEIAVEAFGTASDMPSRALLTAMLGGTAVLLFAYVRRRVGPWPALFAATILLFLGSGWENLLWPFQVGMVGSLLAGIGMLLALERGDRRGDALACALLALSIASSSLGISFAVGAIADLVLRRRERGLGRAWVAGVPLLLYAAWYLGYGREAESAVTVMNVLSAPLFVAESIAASAASALGLRALGGGIEGAPPPWAMLVVTVAGAALVSWGALRRRDALAGALRQGADSPLWPAAATAFSFWLLAAINEAPGRSPFASRYMYVGAVMLFLLAAAALAGSRPGRRALIALGMVSAVAVGLNVKLLLDGHQHLEREAVLARAELAALEVSAPRVDPAFWLEPGIAGTSSLINVAAGAYLELAADHGSPAYSEAELLGAPPEGRAQADVVLAAALGVEALPAEPPGAAARCRRLRGGVEATLPPGGAVIVTEAPQAASVGLRRFAPPGTYPVTVELPAGAPTRLAIPADRSSRPWRLSLPPGLSARACSPRG